MRRGSSLLILATVAGGCGSSAPIGEPQFPGRALEATACADTKATANAVTGKPGQLVINNRTAGERIVFQRYTVGRDRVVAVVDGQPILLSELGNASDTQAAVEALIERRLLQAEARRRGIEVTEQALSEAIEQIQTRN